MAKFFYLLVLSPAVVLAFNEDNEFILAEERVKAFMTQKCGILAKSRPVANFTAPINISVELMPYRLRQLDDREQLLSMAAELAFEWRHPCVQWNPSEWQGVTRFTLDAKEGWYPQIQQISGVYELTLDRLMSDGLLEFFSDGDVNLGLVTTFNSFCPLNLEKFPFDIQTCVLLLESYRPSTEVVLTMQEGSASDAAATSLVIFSADDSPFISPKDVWRLVDATSQVKLIRYDNDPFQLQYYRLAFTFHFQRLPDTYILNIFFPCICLIITQLASGLLNENIRPVFNMTVLLASTVVYTSLSDLIPTSSEVALIVYFMGVQLSTAALCTLYALVVHALASDKFKRKRVKFLWFCNLPRLRVFDMVFYLSVTTVNLLANCTIFVMMTT